jgi:hypothetical protein
MNNEDSSTFQTAPEPSGKDAVVRVGDISDSAGVAIGDGARVTISGDVIGRDIVGRDIVGGDKVVISYQTAFERVVGATNFILTQLELSYKQTREQAQGWFRLSLIAAGIGFLLIAIGVIALLLGQTTAGVITTIASLIPNTAAALFFVQSKTANERVDAIQSRLTEAREVQTAVEIVETIEEPKARDKLKAEIVRKVLRLEQKGVPGK